MLSNNQQKTTLTFTIILVIFLTIVTMVGMVVLAVIPTFSNIAGNSFSIQQASCDCVHHASIFGPLVDFPFNGIPLLVFGSLATIFILYVMYVIVRNIFKTTRFNRRLLLGSKSPSTKLLDVATSVNLQDRVLELAGDKHEIFCIGIARPTICISSRVVNRVSKNQLRAILLHEKNHLRSRDPLKLCVVNIISGSLFFIPGLGRLIDQFQTGLELAADDLATNNCQEIRSLGKALLTLASVREQEAITDSNHVAPTFINITETRIERLISKNRRSIFRWFVPKLYISFIVIISAFTILFTSHTLQAKTQNNDAMVGMSGAACANTAPVNTCDSFYGSCHSCDNTVSSCENNYSWAGITKNPQ